jgi:hypothetical protein
MKKFMFTAIAMVAFMGSSMANTIEVEKLNIEKKAQTLNIKEEAEPTVDLASKTQPDCMATKFIAFVDAQAAGFNTTDATSLSWKIYFYCMGQ